jgi:Na+/H+ antiporter NhaA
VKKLPSPIIGPIKVLQMDFVGLQQVSIVQVALILFLNFWDYFLISSFYDKQKIILSCTFSSGVHGTLLKIILFNFIKVATSSALSVLLNGH